MATLESIYIIVPFLEHAEGKLRPGPPRRSFARDTAIAMAERLAPFYAGVIVLRERKDPVTGFFPEPLLVCVIGDVPGDLMRQLAA